MRDLQAVGIDMQQVTGQLLDEGIEKFTEAFNDILQTIGAKQELGRTASRPSRRHL